MILDRIKEIEEAEKNAARAKDEAAAKVKKILASADDEGKRRLAAAVAEANRTAKSDEAEAESRAEKIIENAVGDTKIKVSALKAASGVNVTAAVSVIITAVRNEYL